MKNNMIATIGIPGAGKTVLWSVLASKYDNVLQATNPHAVEFIKQAWDQLHNGDWPVANQPLVQKKNMEWKLYVDNKAYDIDNCDVAGEELLTFLNENQPVHSAPQTDSITLDNLRHRLGTTVDVLRSSLSQQNPGNLEGIEALFANASAICLLLDLTEELNQGVNFLQSQFVLATLNYLKKIKKTSCPLALIVTKCNTLGCSQEELRAWVEEHYMKSVRSYGIQDCQCLLVDAVADTHYDVAQKKLVPQKDFHSEGMEELLQWLGYSLKKNKTRQTTRFLGALALVLAICLFCMWGIRKGCQKATDVIAPLPETRKVYIEGINIKNLPNMDTINKRDLYIMIQDNSLYPTPFKIFGTQTKCPENVYCPLNKGYEITQNTILEFWDDDSVDWPKDADDLITRISMRKLYKDVSRKGPCIDVYTIDEKYTIHYRVIKAE